ncbi:hypothetical protein GCM10027578_00290 [Spirosoma luteolum]
MIFSDSYPLLRQQLNELADLSDADYALGAPYWTLRTIPRHDYFNFRNSVCRHVGLVLSGLFRVYYLDPVSAQEHNLFFIPDGQFLASLKSMVTQTACPYSIEAMEDARLLVIENDDLQRLYAQSHGWERFGRRLAEQYLVLTQSRSESLLTKTAEERYIDFMTTYPDLHNRLSLGHISSYLGIRGPSLSRIRAQLAQRHT